ncbi:MAG: hypothetical protein QGG36_29325 [Pirellulaceae bacterium]|jgi:hypothetical protein|nr:hypothetical protein [Pirellulaceae bacterium]MDP7019935.1 hypothetical protein [Pirellulaceae bacterium]
MPSHQAETTCAKDLFTIRQFAGLSMQALIAHDGMAESESAREEYALWSYRMAQAMLATEKRLQIGGGAEPRSSHGVSESF